MVLMATSFFYIEKVIILLIMYSFISHGYLSFVLGTILKSLKLSGIVNFVNFSDEWKSKKV